MKYIYKDKRNYKVISESNKDSIRADRWTILTSIILFGLMMTYVLFFDHSWVMEIALCIIMITRATGYANNRTKTFNSKKELLNHLEQEEW
jgi:ABC-type iron transport system FetAB permease component